MIRYSLDDTEEANVETWRIFRDGTRVHGLTSDGSLLLVHGGRKLKMLEIGEGKEPNVLLSFSRSQWIMASALLDDGRLMVVGLADNSIEILTLSHQSNQGHIISHRTLIQSSVATQISSMSFQINCKSLRVASGTQFGKILIWAINLESSSQDLIIEPKATLTGHEGVLFSLRWSEESLLSSTSDDRTCRIWDLGSSKDFGSSKASSTSSDHTPIATFYHTSRVWSSHFIAGGVIATACEDNKTVLWSIVDGNQVAALGGHRGKGIWSLATIKSGSETFLFSGGADGSVKRWRLGYWLHPGHHRHQISLPLPLDIPHPQDDWIRCLSFPRPNPQSILFTATNLGWLQMAVVDGLGATSHFSPIFKPSSLSPITCIDSRFSEEAGHYELLFGNKRGEATFLSLFYEGGLMRMVGSHQWQALHNSALLSISWATPETQDGSSLVLTISSDASVGVWRMGEASHVQQLSVPHVRQLSVSHVQQLSVPHVQQLSVSHVQQLSVALSTAKRRTVTCSCLLSDSWLITGDIEGGVCFYPLGRLIDSEEISQPATLQLQRRFKAHSSGVSEVRSGPDARSVVSVGHDSSMVVFYIEGQGEEGSVVNGGSRRIQSISAIQSVSLHEDGSILVGGFHSSDWILFDARSSIEVMRVKGAGGFKRAHAFQVGGGKAVFVCSGDKRTVEVHQSDTLYDSRSLECFPGTHGREINCVLFHEGHILTGSEDGAIRSLTCLEGPSLRLQEGREVGEQSSEVRCFDSFECGSRSFLVSGGSKQQLSLWEMNRPLRLIGSCFVGSLGNEKGRSMYEGSSELRIMALVCLSNRLTVVASSNGCIQVLKTDMGRVSVWQHAIELPSSEGADSTSDPHPTLTMGRLRLDDDQSSWLLFAGRTDGSVRVWKVEEIEGGVTATCLTLLPSVHQSGINGLVVMWGPDRTIKMVTAGDDQALISTTLVLNKNRVQSGESRKLPYAHSSAIKALECQGSSLSEMKLFTVGLDQRVRSWSLGKDSNDLILTASVMVDVLEPCTLCSSSQIRTDESLIVVAGRGIQVLRFDL